MYHNQVYISLTEVRLSPLPFSIICNSYNAGNLGSCILPSSLLKQLLHSCSAFLFACLFVCFSNLMNIAPNFSLCIIRHHTVFLVWGGFSTCLVERLEVGGEKAYVPQNE